MTLKNQKLNHQKPQNADLFSFEIPWILDILPFPRPPFTQNYRKLG